MDRTDLRTEVDRERRAIRRALTASSGHPRGGYALSRVLGATSAVALVIGACVVAGLLSAPEDRSADAGAAASASSVAGTDSRPAASGAAGGRGARGSAGAPGVPGVPGAPGAPGAPGRTATVTVGRDSVAPPSRATVSTTSAARPPVAAARPATRTGSAASSGGGKSTVVRASRRPASTTQTTGWGCYAADSRFHEDGRFHNANDRDGSWNHLDSGGGACNYGWDTMPMSGRDDDDAGMRARYEFDISGGSRACALSVWIPNSGDITQVGGRPTVYSVYRSTSFTSGNYAYRVNVDQPANRDRWVSLGTARTSTGKLVVIERARGRDYDGNGPTHAHHAVTQVRATCTA